MSDSDREKTDTKPPVEEIGCTPGNLAGISGELQVTEQDIESLFKLDKDQLYAVLGTQMYGFNQPSVQFLASMGSKGIVDRKEIVLPYMDAVNYGRAFSKEKKGDLGESVKKCICEDWQFCKKYDEYLADLGEFTKIVTAVIPLIIVGISVPALTALPLAVLVLKYYCFHLCDCPKNPVS